AAGGGRTGRLPAMRIDTDRGGEPVRLHALQGGLSLPGLPGAVRSFQVHLMLQFLPLTVTGIQRETRDAVAVTLAPREEDRARFAFIQGQYLTFRRVFDGIEFRRAYSICAGLDDGVLRVGIKRVDGGTFSTWANESLRVGDVLEAMP